MKVHVTRRYRFPASHQLSCAEFTPERNREVYGKCANPHGHGHNYALFVTVSGRVNAVTGMACDLGALDTFVQRNVLDLFDHANLNALPSFRDAVPTTENLSAEIFRIVKDGFGGAELENVRIAETRKNSFAVGNIRP